ncbi:hypothetical protein F1737_04560 [Methanoplanus sp. FWC-SCC4]|uniref:Type I restriction modification DNA specificity domain-containing protein n=1 Tax=Methanochimaera problematica TaxID=2609417 RepID=A0AA97FEM6_9EURY|nr:restriction endonuclease subunit S [Methanoplanus sp. FWC-SCC4]WOF16026.1 hypothetical protein F1737_04560 [Methanoplanus sp. FWC-SCC4]
MNELNCDNWTSVKLGDVAFDINDRVANPSESGYECFVGLDHLTSGDFTIRNWGSTEDVTSSMKLFKKGDILFGRRNTYLKRASMANFDGVCSGDAYVLRFNPELLVDGYLPLILNSSELWDYTNAHSAGGMSKRAKWRDLANFEFYLPSKEEQRRIADILWAAEDVIVKNEQFLAEAEHYKQLMMRELFHKGIGHTEFKEDKKVGVVPVEWEIKKLSEISSIKTGPFGAQLHQSDYVNSGTPIITVEHLGKYGITNNNLPFVSDEDKNRLFQYILKEGDIVFSRVGSVDRNCLVSKREEGWLFSGRLLRVRPNQDKITPRFLTNYFKHEDFKGYMKKVAVGGIMASINTALLSNVHIPVPSVNEQKQIAAILTQIDETIAAARETIESTKALKMKLINELLSPHLE